MAIKSSFRNGSLILMNPKTGQLANESDSDVLDDFSDDSINSDEFDSEYASDRSDGEQSYSESELLPLSEIWDLDDKASVAQSAKNKLSTDIKLNDEFEEELDELSDSSEASSANSSDDEESDSSTSGDEADSESDVFEGFDDEDDAEASTGLKNVMKNLDKANKKKEKQRSKLVSLNQQESELSIPNSSANKLSLEDMMMASSQTKDSKTSSTPSLLKDIKEVAPLSIPLPRRIQERNERSAAYELSKKEVEKWKDQVEKIKRSEVMKFPLIGEENSNSMQKKVSAFIASDKPLNELEDKVNTMLRDSMLLDTKKEALFEDLKASKISKDELLKKTNETRLMRELLFREERKAKRIKKIKSKSYRRIKKKELLKNAELMKEIEGDEDDKDDDEARAEARMTLKFKNSSSKWAKDMIKHGMTKDKETRAEMESMLQQGQKLRSKILGHGEDSDPSDEELDDISDSESEDEEKASEHDKKLASVGKTGFMNMPFMKKAEAKLKEQNKQEKAKLARLEQVLDLEDFKEGSTSEAKVILNGGRRIYAPEAHSAAKELEEQNTKTVEEQKIDEDDNLSNKLIKKFNNDKGNNKKNSSSGVSLGSENLTEITTTNDEQKNDDEAVNPWLASDSVKKSSKLKIIDENSTRAEKQAHKLGKKRGKKNSSAENDDKVLINTDISLNITKQSNNLSSDDENEDNDDDMIDSFQQKKIIKEAFIGDNVVKEFNREKKRVVEEEDDQWITAEQPGFNSWIGGSGTQRKKQKKNIKKKKVEGIKSKDKRTDKDLKHVIFNEKVNKKGLKYQSSGVPFPFENKEQYERSLRMPIGPEWNTRSTFQKNTMPSVITKSGTVIKPLNKKFR